MALMALISAQHQRAGDTCWEKIPKFPRLRRFRPNWEPSCKLKLIFQLNDARHVLGSRFPTSEGSGLIPKIHKGFGFET